jgi:hypothetical protein
MQDEELLVKQAALIKAANPNTRVWVYRNIVKVSCAVGGCVLVSLKTRLRTHTPAHLAPQTPCVHVCWVGCPVPSTSR